MLSSLRLYLCLLSASLVSSAMSQPQVELEQTFTNLSFSRPVDLQHLGETLFVVEQRGVIWRFTNDPNVQERLQVLNISNRVRSVGNEEGLLGLAFHPDFDLNGYFFVYYTASSPRRTVVSRFTSSLNQTYLADPNSEIIVLEVNQPASNHNGGQIAFGPDGYLYIALGDGGGAGDTYNHGQNTQSLLGTISRIDVNQLPYSIPSDNPFAGSTGGRPEIFAWGLRNPWRFSFDSQTGIIYTADVGQNAVEEVNVVEKGQNYGWPVMEGTRCYRPSTNCNKDGLALPIFEYDHSAGPASVTGGYVYRGPGAPDLTGLYILGDYVDGRFWGLLYDGQTLVESHLLMDTFLSPLSFGIDHQGEVYMLSGNGRIYRFSPTGGSLGFESFISPLQFTQDITIPETILPSARGGSGSYTYSVTPTLPAGLSFDPATRTLQGTPTSGLASTIFTLQAEDTNGLKGSTQFQLSVVNPTATEHSHAVLEGFALQGYYHSSEHTYIVFDLPEPAIVSVDLYDLMGRKVTATSPKAMNSAQTQSIPIATNTLPSGSYIYRITLKVDSNIITASKLLLVP
ncbi:MAG: PQQ-dependent sugar dehydrogenase [Bacteroidetes bacterium]|nr:PQQ-dependent sugar dehydrogenase [Bacteroidota bacterium]